MSNEEITLPLRGITPEAVTEWMETTLTRVESAYTHAIEAEGEDRVRAINRLVAAVATEAINLAVGDLLAQIAEAPGFRLDLISADNKPGGA